MPKKAARIHREPKREVTPEEREATVRRGYCGRWVDSRLIVPTLGDGVDCPRCLLANEDESVVGIRPPKPEPEPAVA